MNGFSLAFTLHGLAWGVFGFWLRGWLAKVETHEGPDLPVFNDPPG